MPINVDLSETERPEACGDFQRVTAGPVHLMVLDIKENGGKNGEHVVKCEVLMHNDKTQIGLTHTEFFPADAKMAWKILNFAYATKVADREAMAKAKASGNNYVPIELSNAVGRQFFGTIKVTEKTEGGNTKTFHNLDGLMSIDDEKAKNHPRNVGMLQQALKDMGAVAATTATQPVGNAAPAVNRQAAADPFASVT